MEPSDRYAAIDIGSNAIRMLFARAIPDGPFAHVAKESMIRMPLRLGTDTFVHGHITDPNAERLIETLIGFSHLVTAYEPVEVRACATSAMRRAANGAELLERARVETGFDVQLIDGSEEARIILSNHVESHLDPERDYVYVDVGGGSTEITFLPRGQAAASRSFSLGAVRLLTGRFDPTVWDDMKEWLTQHSRDLSGQGRPRAIGSGGNINKIFNLAEIRRGQPIRRAQISAAVEGLRGVDYDERVRRLGLRPDRADVIDHAASIYLSVMKWIGAKMMFVPLVGLADGLIQEMYRDRNGLAAP